jgi:hypothetical protein
MTPSRKRDEAKIRKIGWYKVIQELRKGPLSASELINKLEGQGISRRTVYRALDGLERAEVAKEKGGKWYWYEFLRRIFDSRDEYDLILKHSKELCSKLNLEFLLGKPLDDKEAELQRCISRHLETGYPDVNETLSEYLESNKVIEQKREELERRFITEAERSEFEALHQEGIRWVVLQSLKDRVEGKEPFYKTAFRVEKHSEGGTVKDIYFYGAYPLTPGATPSEVNEFVERCCRSKSNLKLCKELLDLEYEHAKKEIELRRQLVHIVNLVEHGTPLQGCCDLCPKIKIKPPQGEEVTSRGSDPRLSNHC